MGIIYIISVIILLTLFVLVKKSEKTINILNFVYMSIVLLFCYNTFICYVLTFFDIPITLLGLSIINILFGSILLINIILKKEIQKYKFNKVDLRYSLLILIVVLIVSYINFGYPFNVNFETGDPATHYIAATMFAKSDALLGAQKEIDEVHGSLRKMKTTSYVNGGLLMKCFSPDLDLMECYNIYVLFSMFTFFLVGVVFYSLLTNFAKKKEHILWAFILSLLCLLGYPLNSFLFGFEYLTMGLLVLCTIINMVYYYQNRIFKLSYSILVFSLLNFGLFSSYYMFVPFVYTTLWMYFYINTYKRTNKIITKEIILLWVITLLIPFGLGYIYHIEPNIYTIFLDRDTGNIINSITSSGTTSAGITAVTQSANKIINTGLPTNGFIYVNLYSNMLLLLPLTIYLFIVDNVKSKLKDNQFESILVFFTISFIIILLIAHIFNKVSMYYLSKNYFALWMILFYCNYKALILISEKNKKLPKVFIGIYVVIMILYTTFSNVKVEYVLINENENLFSVMEVYGANKTILTDKTIDFNQEELEILNYAKENLDFNSSEIEIVADLQPNYWSYAFLRYLNEEEITKSLWGQRKLNLERFIVPYKINAVDYMIYFNKSDLYNRVKDRLFENAEIIYENNFGGILKYNK